jgi:DNA-binding XRE family transcriptional regulator
MYVNSELTMRTQGGRQSMSDQPTAAYAEELQQTLASNVRAHRRAMGVSQATLSRLCGLPAPTLSAIESGDGNRTLRTLARLASGVGVPLATLLSRSAPGGSPA